MTLTFGDTAAAVTAIVIVVLAVALTIDWFMGDY